MSVPFLIPKTCDVHKDETADYFCYQHGAVLCHTCHQDNHTHCQSVTQITAVMDSLKNGLPLEKMEKNICELSFALEQLLNDKNKNFADLIEKRNTINSTIQEAREKLNAYLDKLERSLELEMKTNYDKLVERIERNKTEIISSQNRLKSVLQDISAFKHRPPDPKLFREILSIQAKQRDLESSVMKLAEDEKYFEFHLKLSEAVFGFEHFFLTMGSIVISEKCLNVTKELHKMFGKNGVSATGNKGLKQMIVGQVPRTVSGKLEAGKLKLVSCFPTSQLGKGVKIFRACFLADNNIMLAGYQEKSLYVCNKKGEECKKIRIANFPGGITIYNKTYALVSAWQHGVQKIELENLKAADVIKFRGDCSALSCVGQQICVKNGEDHLKIVDIHGKTIRKMPTKFNPWEIYLNGTGSVFYSNLENSDVSCVFPDGSNYITYSNPELLDPAGLTVDNQENLYVTGSRSNNIHRISSNRDGKEIILSSDDDIQSPSGIAFNKQTNELLIINDDFTSIRIYKVQITDD